MVAEYSVGPGTLQSTVMKAYAAQLCNWLQPRLQHQRLYGNLLLVLQYDDKYNNRSAGVASSPCSKYADAEPTEELQ